MDVFRVLAERKIQEAMREGQFDNLAGEGAPLVYEDETWIPEDMRLAYRILKNSNCIPPEIELRKEIFHLKDLIMSLDDDKERLLRLRELNYKIMKFSMMRKAPLRLESCPGYEDRIIEKLIC